MSVSGQLFVLSAPSGAGKTTVRGLVRQRLTDLAYSVSLTTRPPRPDEQDGVDYHFVSREDFLAKVQAGEMAEHAELFGNLYGTSARLLEQTLAAGQDLLLDIDVQGAAQLRPRFPRGVYIFLLPPSLEELERRLKKRGSEDAQGLAQRLAQARQELTQAENYTHLVLNDQIDQAVEQVVAIITAERLRTPRRIESLRKQLGF